MFRFTIIWIAALLLLISCSSNNSEQRAIVEEWLGKEIVIPNDLKFQIQDTPINYDFNNADFKIVTYIDSTGCTNCKMRLKDWDAFINYCKSFVDLDVNFLMIIESDDYKDVKSLIRHNDFLHPVVFDKNGKYNNNKINNEDLYNTFLLDRDNKVLAIGNPTVNPKIRDLYLKIIRKDIGNYNENYSSYCKKLQCDRLVRSVGVVHQGDTVRRYFRIIQELNNSEIQGISTSCDCITSDYDIVRTTKGTVININLEYVVDSVPGFFKKWVDIYYYDVPEPENIVIYGYNNL